MTDTNSFPGSQVQDKRKKPPGILPRNTQAWVLSGIAVLMVGVIALSGKNPPKERTSATTQTTAVIDPSAARIQEYRRLIEEQTRKLQFEQAQLAHTQQTLGMASVAPMAATPHGNGYPRDPYSRAGEARYASFGPAPEQDAIAADKKKREYQSLFASNIALSFRKETGAQERFPPTPVAATAKALPDPVTAEPPASSSSPGLLGDWVATAAHQGKAGTALVPAKRENDEGQGGQGKLRNHAEFNRSEGKLYRLFEGTFFETVLTNRLDGYYSGFINCMVTTNIYSHDGQRLLVPQGSRILGEVRRVDSFGQQRLAVFFHRVIMPDGYSVSLDQFQGLNQIGETGLRDLVNHHYLQVFGASLAIGAIAGLSQANTRSGFDTSAEDAYRQGVTSSLSQSSLRILDRYLNVLPTFTIREGHRVKVYLSNDLLLPAYEKHQMPSDL